MMKMNINNIRNAFGVMLLSAVLMFVASCSTTRHASGSDVTVKKTGASAEEKYKNKVLANASKSQYLTAKMKVNLSMGEKDISLSGSLKMKRGDVIQLSMTFPIVGEVCRMEFTKEDVLIVDRINTRYVKVPYSKVDFLKSANLDFNVLESIFWNEIFYPGSTDVKSKLADYTLGESGSHTLLSLTKAPQLDYGFLTQTETGLLDRTTVTPKNSANTDNLVCVYGSFVKFEAGKFPSSIKLTFAGDSQTYGLDINLSSLSASSDWTTRTTVSSKYKQMDAEKLFKSLIP